MTWEIKDFDLPEEFSTYVDEDFLYIYKSGNPIATFSVRGVTEEGIMEVVREAM